MFPADILGRTNEVSLGLEFSKIGPLPLRIVRIRSANGRAAEARNPYPAGRSASGHSGHAAGTAQRTGYTRRFAEKAVAERHFRGFRTKSECSYPAASVGFGRLSRVAALRRNARPQRIPLGSADAYVCG